MLNYWFNITLQIFLTHVFLNSKSVHCEVSANPFCLIQNCPWLLFSAQTFFFIILLSLNLYFWRIDGFPFSFHLLIIVLFVSMLCLVNFYFIDLVRESYKKYEILFMMLFTVFFMFIASEALLFLSFFWVALHSMTSPLFVQEGFFAPDPCELTFSNTVLLSHAACSSVIQKYISWLFQHLELSVLSSLGFLRRLY